MDNKEVVEKAQSKKAVVGEMEKVKIDKSNWIAVIVTGILAVAFIIVECSLGHKAIAFMIGAICFLGTTGLIHYVILRSCCLMVK